MLALLLSLLPQTAAAPHGIGTEWLVPVAVLVPFLLLIVIVLAGRRRV